MSNINLFRNAAASKLLIEMTCSIDEQARDAAWSALLQLERALRDNKFPCYITKTRDKISIVLLSAPILETKPEIKYGPGVYTHDESSHSLAVHFGNKDLFDCYENFFQAINNKGTRLHDSVNWGIAHEVRADFNIEADDDLFERSNKQIILEKLDKYIERIITPRKNDAMKSIDFSHDFWFFADSQAKNREVNYTIAIYLKQQLAVRKSLADVFAPEQLEKTIKTACDEMTPARKNHVIRSAELNAIIKSAEELGNVEGIKKGCF